MTLSNQQQPVVVDGESEYMQRKIAQHCPRSGCKRPSGEATVLCEPHALDARARVRKSANAKRAELRSRGLCVDCRLPSTRYRCSDCDKPDTTEPIR